MPINYIICAAGRGERFKSLSLEAPKPLIKLNDRYLLDWSIASLPLTNQDNIIIITQKDDNIEEQFSSVIRSAYTEYNFKWMELTNPTRGQLETAYLSKDLWELNQPIVIYNCDTYFESKSLLALLQDERLEGIIPCSIEEGNCWSFCKVNDEDRVLDVAEKVRIADWASVGFYFFRDPMLFTQLAEKAIDLYNKTHELYVAPLYKKYLELDMKVMIDRLDLFKPMGTPEQIEKYWNVSPENLVKQNHLITL